MMGGQRYTPHTAPFYRAHEPKNIPEADRSYGTSSFSQKPRCSPHPACNIWGRLPGCLVVCVYWDGWSCDTLHLQAWLPLLSLGSR